MFFDFWKQKKHLIESAAILTAIGAIFLAIPLPENKIAENALINVQIVWFFIIIVSIITVFVNFLIFCVKLENAAEKINLDLSASLSLTVIFSLIWILYNLWIYIITMFRDEYLNFVKILYYIIAPAFLSFFIWTLTKFHFIYLKKKWLYYLVILSLSAILSGTFSLFIFATNLDFELYSFIFQSTIISLIIFIITILKNLYQLHKLKK